MKVCVIGGGITGLVCAYELCKRNIEVAVLESDTCIGGIAGTVDTHSFSIEKYYHHFFKSDKCVLDMIERFDLDHKLVWSPSTMGYFTGNRLYDFGTPASLLRFSPLSLYDKFKFGMTVLSILNTNDYSMLENISAHEWILKNAGRQVYEKVWKPLLVTKFGDQYRDISMAWFWGKIRLRGTSKKRGREVLGYVEGSNKVLLKKLADEIEKMGGSIITNSPVRRITRNRNFELNTDTGSYSFDRVICTAPLPVFLDMACQILPEQYIEEKTKIQYTGIVCMILMLKSQFTKYYWLNIGEEDIPFGGLIEHTNLLPLGSYNGNHILYISNYVYRDSPYFNMDKNQLLKSYMHHLKKINPAFNEEWIKDMLVFKDGYAQPVIKMDYSSIKPDFKTPVPGLFTASMCNIFPEDRGINYAVRDGIRVSKEVS